MEIIRSEAKFEKQLEDVFSSHDAEIELLYIDLSNVKFIPDVNGRDEQLRVIFSKIRDASTANTIVVPTFNYDYTDTGVYDVLNDPSQLGALNEFVRRNNVNRRTQTPIFNFCILRDDSDFSYAPSPNPFSQESIYGKLVSEEAAVLNLGYEGFGYTHYIEEQAGVPYRYYKDFPGKIIKGKKERDFVLKYRVRPLIDQGVTYDEARVVDELTEAGVVDEFSLGSGRARVYRSHEAVNNVISRVKEHPHYLLDEGSVEAVQAMYDKFGRPLTYEAVED